MVAAFLVAIIAANDVTLAPVIEPGLTTPSSLLIMSAIRRLSKQSRADSIITDTSLIAFYSIEGDAKRCR